MTWMLENRTFVSLFALLASLILVPVDATCAQRPGKRPFPGKRINDKEPETTVDKCIDGWLELSPGRKLRLVKMYVMARGRRHRRPPMDRSFSRFFSQAIEHAPPEEQNAFKRRIRDRSKILFRMADRFAQSQKVHRNIPRSLGEMRKSGLISKEEEDKILSIQDPRKRMRAYFALEGKVFLRQLHKLGRIDEKTLNRISSMEDFRERRKALDEVRQEAFWKVNTLLLHFMLKPAEQVDLKKTRNSRKFGHSFHRKRKGLERKYGFFFLPIIPSKESTALSHVLRLTPEEETQITRPGLTPEELGHIAAGIFRRQREAFLKGLQQRGKAFQSKIVGKVRSPQKFYRLAFRILRKMGELQEDRAGFGPKGKGPRSHGRGPGPGFGPGRDGPGPGRGDGADPNRKGHRPGRDHHRRGG